MKCFCSACLLDNIQQLKPQRQDLRAEEGNILNTPFPPHPLTWGEVCGGHCGTVTLRTSLTGKTGSLVRDAMIGEKWSRRWLDGYSQHFTQYLTDNHCISNKLHKTVKRLVGGSFS